MRVSYTQYREFLNFERHHLEVRVDFYRMLYNQETTLRGERTPNEDLQVSQEDFDIQDFCLTPLEELKERAGDYRTYQALGYYDKK